MRVDFHTINDVGEDTPCGSITWNGEFYECSDEHLQILAESEEIFDGDKLILSDTPQAWMEALHRHYKSAYFRASTVIAEN